MGQPPSMRAAGWEGLVPFPLWGSGEFLSLATLRRGAISETIETCTHQCRARAYVCVHRHIPAEITHINAELITQARVHADRNSGSKSLASRFMRGARNTRHSEKCSKGCQWALCCTLHTAPSRRGLDFAASSTRRGASGDSRHASCGSRCKQCPSSSRPSCSSRRRTAYSRADGERRPR